MKTLEQIDAEILALKAVEEPLYEELKKTEASYNMARQKWCERYNEIQELKRRRAILAELLDEKKVEVTA